MKRLNSVEDFDDYIEQVMIPKQRTFQVVKSKSFATAVYDKQKNYGCSYRSKLSKEEFAKLWVFSATKKSLQNWIKRNGGVASLPLRYATNQKDRDKIKKLPQGYSFLATDLKHAYWRVAYINGYISEYLYQKCNREEFKLERNKALACVSSMDKVITYEKGVKVKEELIGNDELRRMYSHIRNCTYKIMNDCKEAIGDGFIMYKTDCIFYDKKYKKKVEEIMTKNNLLFETDECQNINSKYFIYDGETKIF